MWLFFGFFCLFYFIIGACLVAHVYHPSLRPTLSPHPPLFCHCLLTYQIPSRLVSPWYMKTILLSRRNVNREKESQGKKRQAQTLFWWHGEKKWNPFCGWLNWLVWYCFMGVNWMQFFSFRPVSLCMATNQTFDDGKYLPKMLYTLICSHSATHMNRYISHHFWQMCDLIAIAGRREKNMLTARAIWECEENHF